MAGYLTYTIITCRCHSKKDALAHMKEMFFDARPNYNIYACSIPVKYIKLYIPLVTYVTNEE